MHEATLPHFGLFNTEAQMFYSKQRPNTRSGSEMGTLCSNSDSCLCWGSRSALSQAA
jgi:hypothetical protein